MKKTFFTICALMLTGVAMAQDEPQEISDTWDLLDMDMNGSYILTQDITIDYDELYDFYWMDLARSNWIPLGQPNSDSDEGSFNGTFDGNGHTIYGLKMYADNEYFNTFGPNTGFGTYMGLFGRIGTTGVVKNLNIDGQNEGEFTLATNDSQSRNMGIIAGVNHGTILNCKVKNIKLTGYANGPDIGGIVGENAGLIRNCMFSGTLLKDGDFYYVDLFMGGIVGTNESAGTLQNCVTDVTHEDGFWEWEGCLYGQDNGTIADCYYFVDTDGVVSLEGRTFYCDDSWNTLCLPFDCSISGTSFDDGVVMELDTDEAGDGNDYEHTTGIEGSTLYLNFKKVTSTIEAGKPYIVKWSSDDIGEHLVEITLSTASIDDISPVPGTSETGLLTPETVTSLDGNVSFIGTFFSKDIKQGGDKTVLFLGEESTLYYADEYMTEVNSLRAYFQLNNGYVGGDPEDGEELINAFNLNFGDGATNVKKVEINLPARSGDTYDLSGRRVDADNLRPGIYVRGGKKILISKKGV